MKQVKLTFNVALQIVCDDNMIFRDILVGWPGSVHDSRVLRNSSLFATAAAKFPGDTHLLGDGGYPLKKFILSLDCIVCFDVLLYFANGCLPLHTNTKMHTHAHTHEYRHIHACILCVSQAK